MFDAAVSATAGVLLFPSGMRLPRSEDRARLIQFFVDIAESDGRHFGSYDLDEIEAMADMAIEQRGVFLGIIDGPERIEAAVGYRPAKPWWGGEDSWYWTDVLCAVHPKHRRSKHFRKLMKFGDAFAAVCGAPVVQYVQPGGDLLIILRLFMRYARMIGGVFLMGGSRG